MLSVQCSFLRTRCLLLNRHDSVHFVPHVSFSSLCLSFVFLHFLMCTLFPCLFCGHIDLILFLHRHRKHFTIVACFLVTTPTTPAALTSFTQTTINEDNNKYFSGSAKHIDANQYHGQHDTFVRARGGIIRDQCKPAKGRQGQCHTSHKSSPNFTGRFKRSRL